MSREWDTCRRKISYMTHLEAVMAKRRLRRDYLWVYHCQYGNHWHLGRPTKVEVKERMLHG